MSTQIKRKALDIKEPECSKLEEYCRANAIPFSKMINLLIERFLSELNGTSSVSIAGPKLGINPPVSRDSDWKNKPIPMCANIPYIKCSSKTHHFLETKVFPALRKVHGDDCNVFEELFNYSSSSVLFEKAGVPVVTSYAQSK